MRSLHVAAGLLLVGIVALTSCASPAAAPKSGGAPEAPGPSAPKRITAAVRGDPHTLSDAINFAAGGSSSS
ncbi:MAG TPA: hypothetical protein VFC51_07945 [Chloroflexota bacterium]|nr:hypothetical protein [Chloroflexota bacterium]